jgi:cytochrome b
MSKIRVWDLPLRLFHWLLAALVITAIITVKIGGNALIWHFYCGYAVLSLLLFRILWGVFGSRYSLFANLRCSPAAIAAQLRDIKAGKSVRFLGHNPIGSLSVLAILAVLVMQAGSGLFANDDIDSEGPLVKFISKELSDRISWFHTELNSYLIYSLIALHVVAIGVYYFKKKEDLVTPMLTGDKDWTTHAAAAIDSWFKRGLALLIFGLCAGAVYLLVNL